MILIVISYNIDLLNKVQRYAFFSKQEHSMSNHRRGIAEWSILLSGETNLFRRSVVNPFRVTVWHQVAGGWDGVAVQYGINGIVAGDILYQATAEVVPLGQKGGISVA